MANEQKKTKTFYHATSMQALQQMMKDGAIRSSDDTGIVSNGIWFDEQKEPRGIYLSDNIDDISHLHENAVKNTMFEPNLPNGGVLLAVDVDLDKLQPDRNDMHAYPEHRHDATRGQVEHFGDIDVRRIKEVTFTYPMKPGGYVEGLGGMGLLESRDFNKKFAVGKPMTLDESLAVIESQNKFVEDRYKPTYETRVMEEQVYCSDNGFDRLRLVHAHEASDGSYQLAITRLNDLDLLAEDAVHREHPMLVDSGVESKTRHHTSYSQADCDAIVNRSDKDGVFLAKTDYTSGFLGSRGKRVVDGATVERSTIPLNHDKHVANTKAKQLEVQEAEQQRIAEEAAEYGGLPL